MKHDGHFVADRAVRAHLIVVSTPSLAFSSCLVEAQEPVGVQALGPEFAVQALDEGVVGRFAWPAEVERDVVHEGPQIELLADEFRSVIETDGLGILFPRMRTLIGGARMNAELAAAHCGQLPDTMVSSMVTVLTVRDAFMASVLARSPHVTGADAAVLIAGIGHTRSDRGVPWHLRRFLPREKILSIGLI
jgi:hypothetical protein